MELLRIVLSRLMAQLRGRRLDAELDDEVRAHLEFAVEENAGRGMTGAQARVAAMRAFGGVTQVKETYRTKRGIPFLEQAWRDVRFWRITATAQVTWIRAHRDSDAGAGHWCRDLSVQRREYRCC